MTEQQFVNKILTDLKRMLNEVQLIRNISKKDLWLKLAALGKHDLIRKLHDVEIKTPGFGTIIVPPSGFIPDQDINDSIIRWLHHKHVNVLDVNERIQEMTACLRR